MPLSTQQKAKDMSQQWWDSQANKISQSTNRKSLGKTQDFIDNRINQAQQQQQVNDDYLYNRQLKDMNLWAENAQSIKTNQDRINREQQVADTNFAYQADVYNKDKEYQFQKTQTAANRDADSNKFSLQLGDNAAQRASSEKQAQLAIESQLYQNFASPNKYDYRYW